MAILGSIIKTALDLNAQLSSPTEDVEKAQEKQLRNLLESAKDTSFGLYHDFRSILAAEDVVKAYQDLVPLHDYRSINRRWWKQQQDHPNISWPGQPKYFALSSGTTGKRSKRIPVTDDMLASFRAVGQSQIAALANFDLPADFFEKDVLMLSSSADLTPHKEHLEGEISGINSSNIPGWFDSFYKPGKEIAAIDDWDERVQAIAEAAPDWDVVALAGIPSWIRMMLLKVIEHHKLETIHDLWPNLRLYASGGVAFEPHRRSFDALTKEPLQVMDTYLASEGFFAFTARPGTMNMRLAIEHGIFFEFIPFDDRGFDETGQLLDNPMVVGINEVEEGVDYALVVSTPAGAWRYLIGDTVKFYDLPALELRISGRTKYFLNVVGSQLSEEKLNAAVDHLAGKLNVEISEYAVSAVKNEEGEYIHQWVLGGEQLDAEKAASILDEFLQDANKNYRVARQKALKGVKVLVAPRRRLYDWLEQKKKKGGQIKLPKVMKTKMMNSLLKFLR
ncbi:GH3 auxin-responsive promoter family protein [Lewinella sp. W8]|uniref:GH3 family domain-containing protein n=1 Tax=Lewinella sp. W8 TaxID=2528208 RepID=UPI0010686459|nr:GH3 auxin-responsive promoter family protein [Lewinella sp. W8]MTB53426.1 GH3 auxin-responsive promoter [Lewinella sp. W8]